MPGFHEDELDALPLPILQDDHVLVGRGGVTYRLDKRLISNLAPLIAIQRPQLADFGAWVNQVNATGTDQDYGFVIACPQRASTDSLNMRERNIPAGDPYAVVLGITLNSMFRGNLAAGIALRESATGKLELLGLGKPNNQGVSTEKWTTATGGRGTRDSTSNHLTTSFLKWCVGGNHYQAHMSFDGVNYAPFSEAILMKDFFTTAANKWGLWANNNSTASLPLQVLAWHFEEVTGQNNVTNFCDYVNKGGSGNRAAQITVTGTTPLASGTLQQLVDGDYLGASTKPVFSADAAGNRQITFQFSAAVIIQEANWLQNSSNGQGTWKWQGSNNGTVFTDLNGGATFTLQGNFTGSPAIGDLTTNTTAYSYYRLQQTAGALTGTPTNRQIHFRIKN